MITLSPKALTLAALLALMPISAAHAVGVTYSANTWTTGYTTGSSYYIADPTEPTGLSGGTAQGYDNVNDYQSLDINSTIVVPQFDASLYDIGYGVTLDSVTISATGYVFGDA